MPQGTNTTIHNLPQAFAVALELVQVTGLNDAWHDESLRRVQQLAMKFKQQLEKNESWEKLLAYLLHAPQGRPLMVCLLQTAATSKLTPTVQSIMARALMEALRSNAQSYKDVLRPALLSIATSTSWPDLHEDLRIPVTTWFCRFSQTDDEAPESITAMKDALRQDNDRKSSIEHQVGKLLMGVDGADLSAMSEVAPSVYASLNDDDKCLAWQTLANLAEVNTAAAIETVIRLIELPELHDTKRPRVLSLLAARACLERARPEARYFSLSLSTFGKHCLSSLHSSLRELRIAAGQLLPCFLKDDVTESIRDQNRQLALEYLRTLSDRDIASEQETLISAWGQVALSCGERELNLVLLRLVDYLGHTNSLICGLAFSEIETIAAARNQSLTDLFQPFWRSIAVSIVQDLNSKPHKAQQFCDLLSTDINSFLVMTQRDTLPSLVLTKKKDILQRIVDARGSKSIRDICAQPRTNLAAILTVLLTQSGPDTEEAAFACLTEVDEGFKNTDLSGLIKVDSVLVASELLKHCGEESESRKSRAYQAFQTFANIEQAAPGQRKAHSKSSRAVSAFFERYILGILTLFSTVLESGSGGESTSEKIRCLKAMAEIFFLTKGNVSTALPQIRACLQSGLEQPELCRVAYAAWLSLLPLLPSEDIVDIVDETFVVIARHWSSLSPELQQQTHGMIEQLVKTHNTVLQENIMTLPSLKGISLLSKFAAEFERLKNQESVESHIRAFTKRIRVDSDTVVFQALTELVPFLEAQQDFIHDEAASEHPPAILSELLRALLDVTVKYSNSDAKASEMCGKALGIVGSVDPNRVEATRKKRQILVLSNFDRANEVIDWVMALFEDVLVKAFKSVSNSRAQGFLAFTIQELLQFCNFGELSALRPRSTQAPDANQRWYDLPEHVRTTLTPFLTSRYVVTSNSTVSAPNRQYPGFSPETSHAQWLRSLTYDLTFKANGDNAKAAFPIVARAVKGSDIAVARFVLPYIVLNVVIGGIVKEAEGLAAEFLAVLKATSSVPSQQECIRLCSESVFSVLDYLSTWLREKRKELAETRNTAYKTGISPSEFDELRDMGQIETVENFLNSIPADVIANQAVECRSYARALFHWEQHIRQERSLIPSGRLTDQHEALYDRLQDIYSQIDEPDGLEGIAAKLPIISEEQQAMNHAKSGRWTAAQAWYELNLADHPLDVELQYHVLRCLKETGQYAPLLRYADSFVDSAVDDNHHRAVIDAHLPMAAEACWMTGDMHGLQKRLTLQSSEDNLAFNVGIGRSLLGVVNTEGDDFLNEIRFLRRSITEGLSMAGTDSLHVCHGELVKLQALYELEALATANPGQAPATLRSLRHGLNAMGSYVQDKQYVLGIRRAVVKLRQVDFEEAHAGALWLTTARLARQSKNTSSAYNAVLKAFDCGDRGAKLEEARLLWHDGHQRQAIQSLEAAIESGIFNEPDADPDTAMGNGSVSVSTASGEINGHRQDPLTGKALLILAKWLDASGQSQTKDMTDRYQVAARRFQRWEKGHYYLGKHYSKLMDAQKEQPRDKQSQTYLTGEMTKLVIDNSLRSIPFGNKYWHETIPRILTLWLELGNNSISRDRHEDQGTFDKRVKSLQACNRQLQKYFERVPAYVFYHALPQLISRITHPHPEVWKQLCNILTRIASSHPSQALWSLLAVVKARDKGRVERGTEILNKLKDPKNKPKNADHSGSDLRTLISQGQRLSDGLLQACEQPVEPRAVKVSLQKNLHFNHKLAPSHLVVPIEATLTASAPSNANAETIRRHKAFTQDKITIQAFTDDVLVLNSLQRPRKITVRGSDGKLYGLLCKPKDDLRKDQRLMEFNGIINRALKRNTESSKRRLYIKTYAVTPLSEESGTIEWVEGIKPIRDILLNLYNRKGIRPNYNEIKKDLDVASSAQDHAHVFADKVLCQFPPLLHEWFTETYPEPDAWYAARLRYARSAAVMSMTGHILGLGDRHGENILLEESTGGVFHVDFNCLFDKGLTFEKPELVPFRLTHNMTDAMGPYGHEGPFRKSSELTLGLLRQERDTLMTVLETFLYDPTTDFVGNKKKRSTAGVPETPSEILESVSTKLKGLLRGETVPLSIEGYVDALIQQATDHFRLASMYIGWCSFL
ncbi:hypothetical protein M409DRAFT_66135 [Zasmidium cellare ATCC 36951]|uniref:Serine/threonine-protein kinase MEC1 n=1 Tax=Zasmidium cellare ATCC 36951 TaxID=1080233 RepID=A0A6A6CIR5_ZASCE|nr:uncharacterized protein M409DRAFT_66135 [Zasmidium cellare ATCC 36951]KAF2167045.1 hypothetical protein M409DRAFT_66135 [Zasmidium cellare ATCC 36951]